MKINKDEFLQKLEILKYGINDNDFSNVSKYLFFTDKKIFSYNGRMIFCIDFELDQGNFILSFNEFFLIIKRMKEEEFDFVYEQKKIIISTKKINIELVCIEQEMIEIPDSSKNDFKKLPHNFLEGIGLTQFCLADDISSKSYLHVKDNMIFCTDGLRITKYQLEEEMEAMLLPKDSLPFLIKLDVKEYMQNEKFIFFRKEKLLLIMFKGTEENLDFEKYSSLWKQDKENIFIELPEDIQNNVLITETLTEKDIFQKKIDFLISNEKIICASYNQFGKIKCETEFDNKNNFNFSFSVHPIFLLEILKLNNKMEVNVQESILLFRGEKFCHFFRFEKKKE